MGPVRALAGPVAVAAIQMVRRSYAEHDQSALRAALGPWPRGGVDSRRTGAGKKTGRT